MTTTTATNRTDTSSTCRLQYSEQYITQKGGKKWKQREWKFGHFAAAAVLFLEAQVTFTMEGNMKTVNDNNRLLLKKSKRYYADFLPFRSGNKIKKQRMEKNPQILTFLVAYNNIHTYEGMYECGTSEIENEETNRCFFLACFFSDFLLRGKAFSWRKEGKRRLLNFDDKQHRSDRIQARKQPTKPKRNSSLSLS